MQTCLEKQQKIKEIFASCKSPEEKYKKIIELGQQLPPFPEEWKVETNIVPGCQSIVYLHCRLEGGRLLFAAASEALISAGLAALLVAVYSDETPETILKCPPLFLGELGIPASLTPGRSNGLASMHLRMQQTAIKFLQK